MTKEQIHKKLEGAKLRVTLYKKPYHTVFHVEQYDNGRIALQLITDDIYREPFATLTVNLPHAKIGDDEIIVKTWSENEDVARDALAGGRFVDTGKRIPTGFVEAQIWRIL